MSTYMLQYSPFSSFTDVSWFEFQIQTTETSVRISDIYAVFQPGPGSILSVNGSGAGSAPPPHYCSPQRIPDLLHHEGVTQPPLSCTRTRGHEIRRHLASCDSGPYHRDRGRGGGGGEGGWVWGGRGQCSDSVSAIRRRSPVWCLLCNSAVSIIIPGDGRWASPSSER